MGVIWTSRTRTRQPTAPSGINWANPIASGLLDSLLFRAAGSPINVARPSISVNKTGSPTVEVHNKGIAAYLSSGASWDIASSTNYAAGDFSFHCVVMFRAFGSYATLIDKDNGGGFREVAFFLDTSGNINYIGIGGSNNSDSVSLGLSLNSFYDIVITRRGSVVAFYVNGVFKGNATYPYAGTTGSTNPLVLARNSSGGGTNTNSVFVAFSSWKRALNPGEVWSLYVNPWQLFAPERRPIFFDLASGSNNTGTLSSTLDAVTLTGVGNVTTSGTLAVTLDAVTLAGIGTAAVTNKTGTLAVTLDAATLTGVGAVTTSGTLAVTLDAATLAGVGSVAVGTNRDGTLAVTLDAATLAGIGAVTTSGTLAVTLDAATLAGVGTAGQAITGTLAVTLDNATLRGIGAIPAAPSTGGGKTTGSNLSRKQKKKLKAVESQEWLKAEETARQLLSDRFTKQTPQEKAQALETYIESLQPVIEALKALTSQIEEVVEEAPVIELTPHQEVIQRFDRLEKKVKSVEELIIILMADL